MKSLFSSRRPSNRRRSSTKSRRLGAEKLEQRQLMYAAPVFAAVDLTTTESLAAAVESPNPCDDLGGVEDDKPTTEGPDPQPDPDCGPPQGGSSSMVPAFNSNPGAKHTLFLDFDGHYEHLWGINFDVVTPAYDTDGAGTISTGEATEIEEIFRRVAEDFAPFDVNVTTVDPDPNAGIDTPNSGKVLRVAIGGSVDDWHDPGSRTIGVAKYNSYNNITLDNLVYVFSEDINSPERVAYTISHEAGHSYGLRHLNVTHPAGRNALMADTLPPVLAARSIWWHGTNNKGKSQSDVAELTDTLGKRADDAGDSIDTAVHRIGTGSLGTYMITAIGDRDFFSFDVNHRSQVTLAADVLSIAFPGDGANLDATIELYSQSGASIASAATATSSVLNAEVTEILNPGTYFVAVGGAGQYGDLGQYTLQLDMTYLSPVRLEGGTLTIDGTIWADDAVVSLNADGDVVVDLHRDTGTAASAVMVADSGNDPPPVNTLNVFARTDVTDILFRGHDGDDDFRNDTPIPSTAEGGAGADYLVGGSADDRLYGGADNDRVFGSLGNDWLYGGDHDDYLYGSAGDDVLVGEAGNDQLLGSAGHDALYGDHIKSLGFLGLAGGDDYLDGGTGNDTLRGGKGNDSLFGRHGVDDLDAGAGNDYLDGGHDDLRDTLRGGTGADQFVQHYERRFVADLRSGRITAVWVAEDSLVDYSWIEGDTKLNRYWS